MRLIKEKPAHRAAKAFEAEFDAEILKSEKLRVTMLMAVIAATMLLQLSISLLALDEFRRSFHGRFGSFVSALLTIGAVALGCLVLQRALLDCRIKTKGKPYAALQYLSALIETSIPTVAMILGAQFIGLFSFVRFADYSGLLSLVRPPQVTWSELHEACWLARVFPNFLRHYEPVQSFVERNIHRWNF
jgi:hypothetical protein